MSKGDEVNGKIKAKRDKASGIRLFDDSGYNGGYEANDDTSSSEYDDEYDSEYDDEDADEWDDWDNY